MATKAIKILNPKTRRYVTVTLFIDEFALATQLWEQTLEAQGHLSLRQGAIRLLAEEEGAEEPHKPFPCRIRGSN
jgi:hypothetical protein